MIKIGLARKVKRRDGELYFQPLWLRIAAVFVVLTISGWFSLVTGAYLFVKHARDFPEVKYFDLAFPHRWEDYRVARGDYYVERAKDLLAEGEFLSALHFLRVGVANSPDNVDGRIALAQIHTARGRPELGIDLLKDRAFDHADNKTYLSALFTSLFSSHEDDVVDSIGSEILGDDREPTERNSLIAYALASANFNRGSYDRAEQFLTDFNLQNSAPGATLLAQIDWERGYRQLAIERLQGVVGRGNASDEAYRLLIQYQWSAGQGDRALQTAILHSTNDPLSYEPRLGLIRIRALRGDEERLQHNIDSFFRLYGNDPEAIADLAAFVGRNGPVALATRLHEHVLEKEMDPQAAVLALIEANVVDGHPSRAVALAQDNQAEIDEWTFQNRGRLHAVLAAAHFQTGNAEQGDSQMAALLARRRSVPRDLLLLSDRLIEIEEHARARQVLNQLRNDHPLHQEALTKLVRLDIKTGNNRDLMNNLTRLLAMRKPSGSLLEDAHRHISSDQFLFEGGRSEILESLEAAIAEPASTVASS